MLIIWALSGGETYGDRISSILSMVDGWEESIFSTHEIKPPPTAAVILRAINARRKAPDARQKVKDFFLHLTFGARTSASGLIYDSVGTCGQLKILIRPSEGGFPLVAVGEGPVEVRAEIEVNRVFEALNP